jgi:hypothetical protein
MPARFSPHFVVYQSVIERYKHRNMWNYSFAFLVCVCETWCDVKERTNSAGFQVQAVKDVWA